MGPLLSKPVSMSCHADCSVEHCAKSSASILVFDALWRSASGDYERGTAALEARGYVDPEPERHTNGFDLSGCGHMMHTYLIRVATSPDRGTQCKPDHLERWRLSALAALLQSTSVGELGLPESLQLVDADPVELQDWLDLAVTATGADWSAIRSDACYALNLEWDDLTRALFLLCRGTKSPTADPGRFTDDDWRRVEKLLRSPIPHFSNAALKYVLRGEHGLAIADDRKTPI